ncbi:unnamed protein product [Adineta steineri]|uniref:Uncharacterized protein n=2 Tax=Adineta steineri TaxID=433720 RepID=A0A814DYH4_9BILA|nr:unnamed protein product [Adineta steineri]
MASDDDDLTTFYANLPSIFESDSTTSIEHSPNNLTTIIDNEKTYQPMFGSFLFADSEPFTRAAFVTSSEIKPTQEQVEEEQQQQQDDDNCNSQENSNNILPTSSLPPLEPVEDIDDFDDDEDDFDGIPIRYTSTTIKPNLNGDEDLYSHRSEDNNLLDRFIQQIEINRENIDNNGDGDDDHDEVESILNDFQDEQQEQDDTITIPNLLKDIPDIDDLDEHEEKDNDRIPFDHMDILDQSESLRSSSPDSLLSSSHLHDDDDVDADDDDEPAIDNHNNDDDDDDDVTQWNDDFLLAKSTSHNDRPNAPLPPPLVLNMHLHDQVDFIDSSRSNSRCSNASSHLSIGYADQAQIFINDDELVTSSESDNDYDNNDKIDFENDIFNCDNPEEISLQINLDYHSSRSSSRSSSNQHSHNSTRTSSPIPDQTPIIAIDEDINEIVPIQPAPIAFNDDDIDDDIDDINDNDLETFTSDQPVLSSRYFLELKSQQRQNEIVHDIVNIRHILNERDNDDEFIAVMHNPSVFEEVLFDTDNEQKSDLLKQTNVIPNNSHITSQLSNENESLDQYQNRQETVSNNEKKNPCHIITINNHSPSSINHSLIEEEEEEENDPEQNVRIKHTKEQQLQGKYPINNNLKQIINSKNDQIMSSDDDDDFELLNTLAQLHGLVHTSRLSCEINQHLNEPNIINEEEDDEKNNLLPTSHNNEKKTSILFNNEEQKKFLERKEDKQSSSLLSSITSSALSNDQESNSTDINLDSDTSSSLIILMNELNYSILPSNRRNLNKNDLLQKITNNNELSYSSTIDMLSSKTDSSFNDEDINQTELQSSENQNLEILSIIEKLVSDTLQLVKNESKQDDKILTEHRSSYQNQNFESSNPIQEIVFPSLFTDSVITVNDIMKHSLTTTVTNQYIDDRCILQDNFSLCKNESSITTTDEKINDESIKSKNLSETQDEDINEAPPSATRTVNEDDSTSTDSDDDDDELNEKENFFDNKPGFAQFEAFASDQPLNSQVLDSLRADIDNELDQSSQIQDSTISIDQQSEIIKSTDGGDNEPWELEDSGDEKLKPVPTDTMLKNDSYTNFFPNNEASSLTATIEGSDDDKEKDNYDDYFAQQQQSNEQNEASLSKTVRFDENINNVAVLTPKDSLDRTESSDTPIDSDDDDGMEGITLNLRAPSDRIADHMNETETDYKNETIEVKTTTSIPRPESNISLTDSEEDLPPPLPPLPPLNKKSSSQTENIPLKSSLSSTTNTDLKRKANSRSEPDITPTIQTTTDASLLNTTESQLNRSFESGIVKYIYIE